MEYPNTLIPDFFKSITLPTYGNDLMEVRGWERRINRNIAGVGAKINLNYIQRTTDDVKIILEFYAETKGPFHAFTIPIELWKHSSIYINELANAITHINWVFDGPVQITTLKSDVYNFDVNLRSVPAISPPQSLTFPNIIV